MFKMIGHFVYRNEFGHDIVLELEVGFIKGLPMIALEDVSLDHTQAVLQSKWNCGRSRS